MAAAAGNERRSVAFIGVCGPSASGKSTVCTRLAAALGSPLIAIQADWYFKPDLPACPSCPRCWECPSSVDVDLLLSQLAVVAQVLASEDAVPTLTIACTKGRTKCLDAEGFVGTTLSDETVYVVVEGFLLFADPRLVTLLTHCLWLDVDGSTGAMRRFAREGNPGPYDDSNRRFVKYKNNFLGHIYKHYEEFRDLQLRNAGDRVCAQLDASLPADEVAEQAVAAVVDAIGSVEARGGSTMPAFRGCISRGQRFHWVAPVSLAGGCWWLTQDGMHEIRRPGEEETAESPSPIEMIGGTVFIMWRWNHLYMLDEETASVSVFTGKLDGVTHLARAGDFDPGDSWEESFEVMEAAAGERRVGLCRREVTPSPFWFGTWEWDARITGYDGCWSLRQSGLEFEISESKKYRGRVATFHHRAVILTPHALLVPKFGHVYVLDTDAEAVQVWNGSGIEYSASRDESSSRILNVFRSWDAGARGFILEQELESILVDIGLPQEACASIFEAVDANKDGRVDYAEFVLWLSHSSSGFVRDQLPLS